MDPRIARLGTAEECLNFEKNAEKIGETALAKQARIRRIQIRSKELNATSDVERECLEAVFAYEETLFLKNGKKTAASRTWQMIRRRGIIAAAEQAVKRQIETAGFRALHELGLDRYTFEAVIMRYPEHFSKEAIEAAQDRLTEHLSSESE